jgi:hypothetical protein
LICFFAGFEGLFLVVVVSNFGSAELLFGSSEPTRSPTGSISTSLSPLIALVDAEVSKSKANPL